MSEWPENVNPIIQFQVTGARGVGKTMIVERIIIPALEVAGYKPRRIGDERWELDVRDGPNLRHGK